MKGRRAGQPVRYRDLSLTRARRLILAAIRSGKTSYKALTSQIARFRAVTDRNRHRARKSKSPSAFGTCTSSLLLRWVALSTFS